MYKKCFLGRTVQKPLNVYITYQETWDEQPGAK